MSQVQPVVRYFVLCEDIVLDPSNPNRISLIGLISAFKVLEPDALRIYTFCVFLQTTGGRGPARGEIVIQLVDTNEAVYKTETWQIGFSNDPLVLQAFSFRLKGVSFPVLGVYSVAFVYNGEEIASQYLMVR